MDKNLSEGLEYASCTTCGKKTTKPYITIGKWEMVKCNSCGLIYLNPRPTAIQLESLYSDNYFAGRFTQNDVENQIRSYDSQLEKIERSVGHKGCILDIGCGYGFLVAAAQRQGWKAKGIDISQHAVAFGNNELKADLEQATIETWSSAPIYNVVVCSHVLEHMPDPLAALQKIRLLMDPNNSVLLIRVPNITSVDRYWHGPNWSGWDLPFHFWFFQPRTLRKLLQQAGFHSCKIYSSPFNPFLHLLAGMQIGDLRSDDISIRLSSPSNIKTDGSFIQRMLRRLAQIFSKIAHKARLGRIIPSRDMEVWARFTSLNS